VKASENDFSKQLTFIYYQVLTCIQSSKYNIKY